MLRATVLLLGAVALLGCGGDASESSGSEGEAAAPAASAPPASGTPASNTPEEVFAAFRTATQENDMPTVVSLLTPPSQGMMTIGLVMSASFMTIEDESKQESLDAIFRKHIADWDDESEVIGENEGPEAIVAAIDDMPGFVREVSDWIDANGGDGEGGFQEIGELGEVTISGDTASAQIETEMGPQPIEFHNVGGAWRIHLPGPETGGAGPIEDDGTPGLGSLWLDDQQFKLRDVVAYETKFFDDPVTVILFTERKINDAQLGKLRTMVAAGGDDEFFVSGPNVKLTLDETGDLVGLFAWADNYSINGTDGVEIALSRSGDSISGKAGMPSPGTIFDSTYRFDVDFETEIIGAD